MKRSLVLVVALSLFLAACASVTAPGTTGVVTELTPTSITVSANGQATTYSTNNRTNVYSVDGGLTARNALSTGQRVTVWADGTNISRINIEP
ncbi:MAG TPA: hypothetical protein VEK57_32130 [Thermoanaerobaculia bacterium]|nr:hypothetical protein [Thermoanaerobaculia bacterium]